MAKRKRRRVQLGSSPEEHRRLARDEKRRAEDGIASLKSSLQRGECLMSVATLAVAERNAGQAFADARAHVSDLAPYRKLLEKLEDLRQDVMACVREKGK